MKPLLLPARRVRNRPRRGAPRAGRRPRAARPQPRHAGQVVRTGLRLSRRNLQGPRAGRHQRARSGGVPPHDPHAPGTARPAHAGVRQGRIQAPALRLSQSSRQADHPHGSQVSAWEVSRTAGRHTGGSCPRTPGRPLIKRAKLRLSIGAWLVFGVGSPIPWREIRMPLVARSATLPVPRAALIAGNESGSSSVTHRANHVALPSMVQRDQRNHFPPPVLTGSLPLGS